MNLCTFGTVGAASKAIRLPLCWTPMDATFVVKERNGNTRYMSMTLLRNPLTNRVNVSVRGKKSAEDGGDGGDKRMTR